MHDLRLAVRQLGKSPGFSLTVIVTLALGIGACTAMFSIVNTSLLNPPNQVRDPKRVVAIGEKRVAEHRPEAPTSVPTFLDWKRLATSFETITASGTGRATLTGRAEPLPLVFESFAEGSEAVVPRPVILGRWFQPEEFTAGRDRVVVLRYEFWQQVFGGDPDVISRTITLTLSNLDVVRNDETYTVIGVTAPQIVLPRDLILPLVFSDQARADRSRRNIWVTGRLKPGVTIADAQAEMNVIAAQLAQEYPATNKDWSVSLLSVADRIWNNRGSTLVMMMAAVVCVLLIACANVANLQLVRATTRHREISIRAALGAGRIRLVRQLLTENLVLALLGGTAGMLLAHWALAAFNVLAPGPIRRGLLFEVDAAMLVFALGLSVGTGLLFGLMPAWLASRVDLNRALKQATRGSTEGGRGAWLRSGMVMTQVACAVVLLAGAGLFLQSFNRLANVDPGFAPERAIGLRLFNLSAKSYPTNERRHAFVEAVLERMRALPGVQAAGAALQLPINDSQPARRGFAVDDAQAAQPKAGWPEAAYYTASTDYFRAAGFRMLSGRAFTAEDHAGAQRVAIINETLARRHFANRDPLGQTIRLALDRDDGPRVIVGVVSDIKQHGLSEDSMCQVYEPNAQGLIPGTAFVVRHVGDPAALIPLLKQQVYAVDKNQPITAVAPLRDMFDANIETPRFRSWLIAVFSVVALLIAAVGIYGVMAYSVSQRTTEIGIRMALGATSNNVLRHEFTRGMRIVVAGLALGLVATLALSHLIASMLFHTSPRDPVALAAIMVVLSSVALLACWLPARRATNVDPLNALRAE